MLTRSLLRPIVPFLVFMLVPLAALAQEVPQPLIKPAIVHKIQSLNERLEMTVHTSRILTTDPKITQTQVGNPDILELTVLSPNQIQVAAKSVGVTQVNLWSADQKVFSIDVIVYPDVQQLEMVLRSLFPNAALKVTPIASAVAISGFVDKAEHVDRILRIAEEYYPKVLNNMTVGGCQQVLLHVKVMEVSRTKLRRLGFDFSKVTGPSVVTSSPGGLLGDTINGNSIVTQGFMPVGAGIGTFAFGVVNGASAFFGVLDALRQDNLLKIVSDPTLVTVSGRPASFNSGGEIPIPVPQSLGTISIEWKKYGTQVDFVPIVLGNGKIRLEVRPRISELDETHSLTIQGTTVPAIKSREADTGVEMESGQTLAIAGLVQKRLESQNRGLPWISEVPYLGVPFRSVKETVNEVELLMLVTPELVDALEPDQVPQCGPGMQTTSPSDWELFMKGHLEVPKCPQNCNANCLPSDDMIGPGDEPIPTLQPTDATGRSMRGGSAGMLARRQAASGANSSSPYNRYTSSKPNASVAAAPAESPNGPPGFIGPIGYDVVK